MKRYYRNRHASFLKELLGKKEEQKREEEEKRAKAEKRKQKVRDKALANLNVNFDASAEINADDLPSLDGITKEDSSFLRSTQEPSSTGKRMARGNSVAAFGATGAARVSSLSARPSLVKQSNRKKLTQEEYSTEISSKAGLPPPKSKEAKRAQMKDAYG